MLRTNAILIFADLTHISSLVSGKILRSKSSSRDPCNYQGFCAFLVGPYMPWTAKLNAEKNHRTKGWIFQQTMFDHRNHWPFDWCFSWTQHDPGQAPVDPYVVWPTLNSQDFTPAKECRIRHKKFSIRSVPSLDHLVFLSLRLSRIMVFPYPLVNIQKTMEKNTIVHGKIHYK